MTSIDQPRPPIAHPSGGEASLIRVSTDDCGSLDRLLSGNWQGAYERDFADERLAWLASAASHHIEHCPLYARLATSSRFTPEQLQTPDDLERIPLVPASLFKKKSVVSRVSGELVRCRSSGTKGTVSEICRDEPTMERFVAGLLHGAAEFYERHEGRRGFVLGPSTDEAGTLWFSYVLSLLDLAFDTDFFVRNEEFRPEVLAAALADLAPGTQPLVIGPPVLVVDFCHWLLSRGQRLDLSARNALVVTAGGWKSHSARAIDRSELTQLAIDALGVEAVAVRDVYNMVELNSLLFECELKNKHVPPWLEVVVRDPSDLSRVGPGREGVLTFLDPTPTSYPGFVFSDDLGTVSSDRCGCGRMGQTLTIRRRLAKVEERGCALKMSRYSGEQKQ
jgi:long-chain-fatty-acid---luciferin-component ligase